MFNYIATHSPSGEAVFSSKVEAQSKVHDIPCGTLEIIYTVHNPTPLDLTTEADLDQYKADRVNGFAPGTVGPPTGSAVGIITFDGDLNFPLHRTMTLDVGVMLEGVVELHLESGEMRVLNPGDSFVQRGTLHGWKNITPGGGKCKMVGISYGAVAPIEVGGKKLGPEFPG